MRKIKKRIIFSRILIIIFLLVPPTLVVIFNGSTGEIELSRYTDTTGEKSAYVSNEVLGISNMIMSIIDMPFIKKKYNVCFEDVGSYIYYESRPDIKDKNYIWSLEFDNRTNLIIEPDSRECVPYLIGENEHFVYDWKGNVSVTVEYYDIGKQAQFRPSTRSFAILNTESMIIFSILIYVSWFAFFLIIREVSKLVKNGWWS